LQTHTVPDETAAKKRLALQMGFKTIAAFQKAQSAHTGNVRRIYQNLLAGSTPEASASKGAAGQFYIPSPSSEEGATYDETFLNALTRAGFSDAKRAAKTLAALAFGPGFGHVAAQTSEKFIKLLPKIFSISRGLADPDIGLQEFEQFVERYGSRGAL